MLSVNWTFWGPSPSFGRFGTTPYERAIPVRRTRIGPTPDGAEDGPEIYPRAPKRADPATRRGQSTKVSDFLALARQV